jgi:hypothetical protein
MWQDCALRFSLLAMYDFLSEVYADSVVVELYRTMHIVKFLVLLRNLFNCGVCRWYG